MIRYIQNIDFIKIEKSSDNEKYLCIKLWFIYNDHKADSFTVELNGNILDATEYMTVVRKDVAAVYPHLKTDEVGLYFKALVDACEEDVVRIHAVCGKKDFCFCERKIAEDRKNLLDLSEDFNPNSRAVTSKYKGLKYYFKDLSFTYIKFDIKQFFHKGFRAFKDSYLMHASRDFAFYDSYKRSHMPLKSEYRRQSKEKFVYMPLINLIIPGVDDVLNVYRDVIESIGGQTYGNYQISILNDGITADISGDILIFLDRRDILSRDALYLIVKGFNEHPDAGLIYGDEDMVNADGSLYFSPIFKPSLNIDLLYSFNYIGHVFAIKSSLFNTEELFNDAVNYLEDARDYECILKAYEKGIEICHIPEMLHSVRYAWEAPFKGYNRAFYRGVYDDATDEDKQRIIDSTVRVLSEHFHRIGTDAKVSTVKCVENGTGITCKEENVLQTEYYIKGRPLVSIIIPNKDEKDTLKNCIDSVLTHSTYDNYEIIIVENNSTTDEIREYYKSIESTKNIRVIQPDIKGFNFSKIINEGVKASRGDYYILLNNDTQVITSDWIEKLLGMCMRKNTGIVGAKLLFQDDTIQHCGVCINSSGANHLFSGYPADYSGHFDSIDLKQNFLAVTAACFITCKEAFEKVHGFDETFPVNFNDVDYCLKIYEAGYLISYNPEVVLYHYESKSRGGDYTPEKLERLEKEVAKLRSKWGRYTEGGDPFYNPKLRQDRFDYEIRLY